MKTIAKLAMGSLVLGLSACVVNGDSSDGADGYGQNDDAINLASNKVALVGRTTALDAVRARNVVARRASEVIARLYFANPNPTGFDLVRFTAALDRAVTDFVNAEVEVDFALIEAWAGIELRANHTKADASLALRLAALETEVWVRRSFGPTSHTTVSGLEKSDACRGGILEDGLLERHALAQTRGFLSTSREESDALRRIATQIACLGALDVARLDAALEGVANGVEQRLTSNGLAALIPSYQRMIAPVMLLVLDAAKHHGEYARSYHWFAARKTALRNTINMVGWSSSRTVFLYDRRRGDLIGFPQCTNASAGCIDPLILLDSIGDPRALGLGTCGLDAMVLKGAQPGTGGAPRYTCPSVECASTTPPPAGGSGSSGSSGPGAFPTSAMQSASQAGANAWRQIFPSQWLTSDSTLAGVLCIPGSAAGKTLLGSANESCIDEIFANAPKSPFDSYLTCMAAGIVGPGEGGSMDELGGIPSSPKCELTEEQKTDAQKAADKKKADDDAAKKAAEKKKLEDKIKEEVAKLTKKIEEKAEKIALKKARDAAKEFVKAMWKEIAAAAGGSIVISLGPALPVAPGALLGGAQDMVETKIRKQQGDAIARGDWAEYERLAKLHGGRPGDVEPHLRKVKECTDPMRCGNQCSSLGAQVSKATACSQGFVTEVMRRAGIPARTVPPTRDFGRVSKPRPDAVPAGGDATGVCISGAPAVRTGLSACGAVLCTGSIAAGSASSCCGGAVTNMSLNRAAACYAWNCGDRPVVVDPNGVCSCDETQPVVPPPGNPLGPPAPPR